MRSRLYICAIVIALGLAGSAKAQIGGGYSRLTLDTLNDDTFDGAEIRFRIPTRKADEKIGGLQTNFLINIASYGGDAFMGSYEIDKLSMFSAGFELAAHFNLAGTDTFLVPSISGGGTMAFYQSSHLITPSILDRKDEKAYGWMANAGLALTQGSFGIEVSYGWNEIDFNSFADGVHNQLYIGLFQRF